MLWSSRAEGEEVGRKKAKFETARKMLTDDVPLDLILKYTGLTKEDVEQIQANG